MTTPSPRDFSEAATSILAAASTLFDLVKPELGRDDIQADQFLEFVTEAACYVLHLHDRTLAMPAFRAGRAQLMDGLVVAVCNQLQDTLRQLGLRIPVDQTVDIFTSAYNERQREYGIFSTEDWLMQVSLRFGQHAAEVCGVPVRGAFALRCAFLAPESYKSVMRTLPLPRSR